MLVTRRFLLGSGVCVTLALPDAFARDPGARDGGARDAAARPPAASRKAVATIVLDPGHGGKDPGAIGVSGTYEKHIALAAAQELQRQLAASGRFKVELTRTRDIFIPLEQRVAIAQRRGAHLFVSMHADALDNHSVRGASVYTLGDRASDAQSAALAVRENASDRFAGPGFRGVTPEVARILASLVRQETRTGSARMAHGVVGELGRDLRLLQNPQRQASFMVLKAADIPSILVEMGFMSNRDDEAALRRPEHRARVAGAMKRAIEGYFAALPATPPPTQPPLASLG